MRMGVIVTKIPTIYTLHDGALTISRSNARTGTTTVPTVCRAGGAGPSDQVCEGVADAYVTLVKGPSS
jgi:hypothetical protein